MSVRGLRKAHSKTLPSSAFSHLRPEKYRMQTSSPTGMLLTELSQVWSNHRSVLTQPEAHVQGKGSRSLQKYNIHSPLTNQFL